MEAWQRRGDQIKPIINNMLFQQMLLFPTVLAKWQEQLKGHSPSNKALAAHKRRSKRPHEGQPEGVGKAQARSDCLSPNNGTNFQCSYAS